MTKGINNDINHGSSLRRGGIFLIRQMTSTSYTKPDEDIIIVFKIFIFFLNRELEPLRQINWYNNSKDAKYCGKEPT